MRRELVDLGVAHHLGEQLGVANVYRGGSVRVRCVRCVRRVRRVRRVRGVVAVVNGGVDGGGERWWWTAVADLSWTLFS